MLGLFAGQITKLIMKAFPTWLLCILMLAAGLELAKVGESLNTSARDLKQPNGGENNEQESQDGGGSAKDANELTDEDRQRRWAVMLWTVAGILAFRNDAVGFVAGLLCHWSFRMFDRWDRLETQPEGRIRLDATA